MKKLRSDQITKIGFGRCEFHLFMRKVRILPVVIAPIVLLEPLHLVSVRPKDENKLP